MDELSEGTVTILFTDVEGSTDLGRVEGDEVARRILRAHDEVVRAQIAEHKGRAVKALGDGFMAAFTSARAAISCAVGIQQALDKRSRTESDGSMPVRIGLNSGEVIHEEGDLFGSAVSAAARITAQAKGQQILASEVVKALVGTLPGISFRPAEVATLKGFEEEWRLYEVEWRSDEGARFRRTPFVGRDAERAEITAHLNDLSKGTGALVLISGEPGVGKTRLAEEASKEASRRGHRTLVGRSYDVDSPVPYLPFTELLEAAAKEVDSDTFRIALGDAAGEIAKIMPQLRNVYDDIPPGLELPPEQERRYLFNSIVEFLKRAASTRPLVLMLDDIHWADEASLSVLQQVAQHLESIPVLIIGTYRDVELDVNRPLVRVLDDLLRRRLAHRISLKRFSEGAVEAMLTKLADREPPRNLVQAVYRETDGNAFFVEEVFRHLLEQNRLFDTEGRWQSSVELGEVEVPEGVRLVVGRRLEGLGEHARKALRAAAVVGRSFDYRLLETLQEVNPDSLLDAVDQAEQLTLIEPISTDPTETRFQFNHELIRQTLLSDVSLPRRQQLHLRVAKAMEKIYERDLAERAAEIVNHLYRSASSDAEMTTKYLLMAGARAQQSAAFKDAFRYYEDSLGLVESDDDARTAEALVGLGHAERSLGDFEEALSNWRRALSIYQRLGDHQAIARVAHDMVLQLGWAGQWEELIEIAAQALAVIGDHPTPERCLISSFAGVGISWIGQYEAADPMVEEALQLARSLGDDVLLGICLTSKAVHRYAYGGLEDCIELTKQGMDLLRETEAQWNYATALAFLTITFSNTGRSGEVEPYAAELDQLSDRLGFGGGLMFANRARIVAPIIQGEDIERLERLTQLDLEICERHNLPWTGQSHAFISRARYLAGDLSGSIEHARLANQLDLPGVLRGFTLGVLFIVLAYAGRRDEALGLWDDIGPALPQSDTVAPIGAWMLLSQVVEGLSVLREHERAADLYPKILAVASTQLTYRFDGRPYESVAGLAAAAGRQWDAAEEHFTRAMQLADNLDLQVERLDTLRFHGMALLEKGDTERAKNMLESALAGYKSIGIPVYESFTEELLTRLRT
ncbi:MAG: AAA family ATPase [Actinomycetota bacterium]|nr:AAA family ATPase [Actinomycetota bacterium]